LRKGIAVKSLIALLVIATLGVFAIGCETKKGTTENKTTTTVIETKDGKVTGKTETTTTDTTKTTQSATPGATGKTTETQKKSTETETSK
jgi:hypothetical protein